MEIIVTYNSQEQKMDIQVCQLLFLQPKTNLSPNLSHQNVPQGNPWALGQKYHKKGSWGHGTAVLVEARSVQVNLAKAEKGRSTSRMVVRLEARPVLACWNWALLNNLEARPCLIFLHRIFIFLASTNSKSCSRSFHPLIMLQNPVFCSKTQSFIYLFLKLNNKQLK